MNLRTPTRRMVIFLGLALMPISAGAQTHAQLLASKKLSVEDAHELAKDGTIILLDIRRPDEWAATGVGEGATPLDMRRKDFLIQLDLLVNRDKTKPVAVMCARGVRSKWLSTQLENAGYSQIIDVPEGMLGSKSGPGWVGIGLPIVK